MKSVTRPGLLSPPLVPFTPLPHRPWIDFSRDSALEGRTLNCRIIPYNPDALVSTKLYFQGLWSYVQSGMARPA
jgi:hypothetical protein